MKFQDLLRPDRVVSDLKCGSYEELFRQLIAPLAEQKAVSDADDLVRELVERERLMSTAIKAGIAIPHAFTTQVGEPMAVVGRCPTGTDFNSFDGSPTYCFFLLIEPATGQVLHLRFLAEISQIVEDRGFMPAFKAASTPKDIIELLR